MRSLSACLFLLCTLLLAKERWNEPWSFTTFDVPNAYATQAQSINASGAVCGTYNEGITGPTHAFIRNPDGAIINIDVPGSAFTLELGINDSGEVVGFWSRHGTER